MLEIYNEKVRDLLCSSEMKREGGGGDLRVASVMQDGKKVAQAIGATRTEVRTMQERREEKRRERRSRRQEH